MHINNRDVSLIQHKNIVTENKSISKNKLSIFIKLMFLQSSIVLKSFNNQLW